MKTTKPRKIQKAPYKEPKPTIRFAADLVRSKSAGNADAWAFLTLPKAAHAKVGVRGTAAVEGVVGSFPFRSMLESDGKGSAKLRVSKRIYDFASKDAEGGSVSVEITRIEDEEETRMPSELSKALMNAPRAKAVWADITPIARRDWIFWIITGKMDETRLRRIEKASDMLSSGKRRVCCFGGINWLMKQ